MKVKRILVIASTSFVVCVTLLLIISNVNRISLSRKTSLSARTISTLPPAPTVEKRDTAGSETNTSGDSSVGDGELSAADSDTALRLERVPTREEAIAAFIESGPVADDPRINKVASWLLGGIEPVRSKNSA